MEGKFVSTLYCALIKKSLDRQEVDKSERTLVCLHSNRPWYAGAVFTVGLKPLPVCFSLHLRTVTTLISSAYHCIGIILR